MTCPTLPSLSKLPVSSLLDVSPSVLRNLLASTYDVVAEVMTVCGESISLARVRNSTILVDAVTPDDFAVDERLPYWSELWPSSMILAEHIVRAGKCREARVLDLGCGLGLTGIFAAIAGGNVHMTDYEYDALVFTAYNVLANIPNGQKTSVSLECFDWRSSGVPSGIFDVVIGSDVLYERKNFTHLLSVLSACLKPDGVAFFSDPDRSAAADFLSTAKRNGYTILSETYARNTNPSKIMVHALRRPLSNPGH